jgi:hypothetical protein
MKMHDELKQRLDRAADAVHVAEPPIQQIEAHGGRRRFVRHVAAAMAAVVLAAGLLFPLWALSRVGTGAPAPGSGDVSSTPQPTPQASPWDPAQNVLWLASGCDPGDGTVIAIRVTADGSDPAEACSQFWHTGDLSVGAFASIEEGTSPIPHQSVPPLVACAELGGARILEDKGPETCQSASLSPMPPDYRDTIARFDRVMDGIRPWFPEDGVTCTNGETATSVWREQLDANGFTSWHVENEWRDGSQDKPCASFSIDWSDLAVVVVNDSIS